MKSFIIKSLVFVLAVCLLFKLLDVIAVNGLSHLDDNDYKDLSMLYNNEIDDDVLILGSSRSWRNFDIREIERITEIKTRVIGLNGADYNMQRALWEPVLNSENDIKYIVHVVGLLEFGQRVDGLLKKYKFIPHLDNEFVYNNLSNTKKDLWKDRFVPLYKFHGKYKHLIKGVVANFNRKALAPYTKYKGFEGLNGVWDGINDNLIEIELPEDNIKTATTYIREEAQLALENDKVLILVYTPEHIRTNDLYSQKTKVIKILEKIESDFKNVYFLNYNEWYGNKDPKLYNDPIHMNVKGAKLFSQDFAKDFLTINQKENQ